MSFLLDWIVGVELTTPASGWSLPAVLFLQRVGYSSPCRAASWPWNFQLFADGPHGSFFDFAMARDAGDLVQRGWPILAVLFVQGWGWFSLASSALCVLRGYRFRRAR